MTDFRVTCFTCGEPFTEEERDRIKHGIDLGHPAIVCARHVSALRARAERAEADLDAVMAERDRATDAADALAACIGGVEEIGEHTNMNDPWTNAVNLASEKFAKLEAVAEAAGVFSAQVHKHAVGAYGEPHDDLDDAIAALEGCE